MFAVVLSTLNGRSSKAVLRAELIPFRNDMWIAVLLLFGPDAM